MSPVCGSGLSRVTPVKKKPTYEALQCPANSKRHDIGVGQGYSTLFTSVLCLWVETVTHANWFWLPMVLKLLSRNRWPGDINLVVQNLMSQQRELRRKKWSLKIITPSVQFPQRKSILAPPMSQQRRSLVSFVITHLEPLCEASTFKLDEHVRQVALACEMGYFLLNSVLATWSTHCAWHPSTYKKLNHKTSPARMTLIRPQHCLL